VFENAKEILHDERLAARERELPDAQRDCFIDEGLHVGEAHPVQAPIAGFRAFKAERTREVAGGARVKPQLTQGVGLNVASSLARWREPPVVASRCITTNFRWHLRLPHRNATINAYDPTTI